jgi:hypothetical protein
MKYLIPEKITSEFLKIASANLSQDDGGHIETLAFLIGFSAGDTITGTHLIFPAQNGTSSVVNDLGKTTKKYKIYYR